MRILGGYYASCSIEFLCSSFRILFLVTPIYIGEITRETVRGRILSLQGLWIALGFAVSFYF